MCREWSLRLAAFGAFGVLLLSPVAAGAQSAPRSAPKQTATAAAKKPQLEPKAIEVLKAVGNRLAAAQTVSVVAVETLEGLRSPTVLPVSANRSEVILQRPDKMRVIVSGEGTRRSEVYCNGKTMLTYSPDEKALVIAKAPPTINECLKDAYKASAIDSPFVDLIVADPDSNVIPALTRATYVGQSRFAEETTDVVTYSGGNVFLKMWVGKDNLPRRLQAVYVDEPNRLRRSVVISDWKIDVPVRPEVFTQLKTDNRDHVESTEPRPVGTSGLQRALRDRPLTIHTYGAKYWGYSPPAGVGSAYNNYYGGYYQSPDGYTYYAPENYGAPCYDCGNDYWATEGVADDASFNLSLSTSDWYNGVPVPGFSQTIPNVTTLPPFEVGQIMTTLPVGCAAYTGVAAFYLCGSQWFAGVYGPNGELYFRVISPPY
jgi:hypothetical protein